MTKGAYGYVVRILVALGWLMCMTGCEATADSPPPVGSSPQSTETALFIEQFAREALAAFLF